VIVDTTVWIDYLPGSPHQETERLHRELSQQRLGLTDLILCKVRREFAKKLPFVKSAMI